MKRYLLILIATLLAGCGKPKQQLNVFFYPDYIDPSVVADFERQFDCKVTMDFFESVQAMMAKLAAGGVSAYDVVVTGHWSLPALIQRGLVAPLRHENIPNFANIGPQFLNPKFDPENRHGAPYLWGTTGIFLRKAKDKPVEETWGLIFDPAKQPGPFLLLEDARHCIGAALLYKGYRMNTVDPKELVEARDLLLEAKKRSLGFATGSATKSRVLAQDAMMAMAYSNDSLRGEVEDGETHYFVPREGGARWLDSLSIPAKASHRDLAEKFINHVLDAKVGAKIANFTRTATANKAALEFINSADRENSGIYPHADVVARLEYDNDLGEHNKLYDEIWTQIKSK
ncbi:MAG: spermidine/putrescine ABC transporter substrate-binding protein [Pedosphaera sp.]|nr:spermidine/putrescine ABC transporter substrate-binding protein [Pedosphaera sp.]